MTNKELGKLSRRDLLELLVQQEQENEMLQAKVDELEERAKYSVIHAESAGSLAEAALSLNGVFESADKAAAQYIESAKRFSEQQESIYNKIVSTAEKKAKAIIEEAEKERQKIMEEADEYWKEKSGQPNTSYKDRFGPSDYMPIRSKKKTSINR